MWPALRNSGFYLRFFFGATLPFVATFFFTAADFLATTFFTFLASFTTLLIAFLTSPLPVFPGLPVLPAGFLFNGVFAAVFDTAFLATAVFDTGFEGFADFAFADEGFAAFEVGFTTFAAGFVAIAWAGLAGGFAVAGLAFALPAAPEGAAFFSGALFTRGCLNPAFAVI